MRKISEARLSGRVTDNALKVMRNVSKHETFSPAELERRAIAGVEFISEKIRRIWSYWHLLRFRNG